MDRFNAENQLYHWGALLREEGDTYSGLADKLRDIAEEMRTPPIGRRRREVYEAATEAEALGKHDLAEKLRELARTEMSLYR